MRRWLQIVFAVIALSMIAIYCAFPHLVADAATLKAVAAESKRLLQKYPVASNQAFELEARDWPPAIAALKPFSVTILPGMVDITVEPYFDGGWGYGYASDKRNLTMLVECWSDLGHELYWHGPC